MVLGDAKLATSNPEDSHSVAIVTFAVVACFCQVTNPVSVVTCCCCHSTDSVKFSYENRPCSGESNAKTNPFKDKSLRRRCFGFERERPTIIQTVGCSCIQGDPDMHRIGAVAFATIFTCLICDTRLESQHGVGGS